MRRDEQLSALMDDDLSQDELRFLLKGLESDKEGRETWRRYHDIGEALRGAPENALKIDLSARVMAEIAAEPEEKAIAEPTWMKRVVSFAVAASVATVAVFVANDRGVLGPEQGAFSPSTASVASVNTAPAARQSDVADWQQVSPEVQDKINRYLGTNDSSTADPAIAPPFVLVGHRQSEADKEAEDAVVEVNEFDNGAATE